jgi:hypothetical protein
LGAATRFYPSTRAVLAANDADFPYTWSVLLGRGRTSNEVGFVVFVTRRSLATPVLIRAEFPKPPPVANSSIINTFPVEQMDPVSGSVITGVAPDAFIEGGFLVRAADAQLFRVLSIQPGVPQITLDGFADANSNGEEQFWFIPVDPATGRSPVVGVYVRSLPL